MLFWETAKKRLRDELKERQSRAIRDMGDDDVGEGARVTTDVFSPYLECDQLGEGGQGGDVEAREAKGND